MRLGITGAMGFVGRALVAAARARGHAVIGIVRRAGEAQEVEWRAAGDLGAVERFEALVAGCDAVVNLAARVHIADRDTSEAAALHDAMNRAMPLRLAEAARAAGARVFVQASTVAAIASRTPHGCLDDSAPPAPDTPYGRAKLAADGALAALADNRFAVTSLRPPAVFGPRAAAHFRALLGAARRGLPLPIGGFTGRRSFLFVDNLADAILRAIEAPRSGAYIVTDSPPLATPALYRGLLARYGHGDRVFAMPGAALLARAVLGERAASLTESACYGGGRFIKDFAWEPPVEFEDALTRTVNEDAA